MMQAIEPSCLPKGWTRALVADMIEFLQHGTSEKASDSPNGILVLRMGNIRDGKINLEDVKYLPDGWSELPFLPLALRLPSLPERPSLP